MQSERTVGLGWLLPDVCKWLVGGEARMQGLGGCCWMCEWQAQHELSNTWDAAVGWGDLPVHDGA